MTPESSPASATETASDLHLHSILLPTDFSDASDRAAYVARGLAIHFGSKLYLVHAIWQKGYDWDDALYQLEPSEDISYRLTEQFAIGHELNLVPHESIVVSGPAIDVVKRIVEEKNIDLIILGTNGLAGTAKLLFGRYSEQIYRNATCPVLTVGPHVSKCDGAFQSIVFAMNPESDSSADALAYAIGLARSFNAHLTVATILPEPRRAHGEKIYREEEEKREQISKMLTANQLVLPHKSEIIIETGHISEEIIKIAVGSGADLIVKGVRPQIGGHSQKGHTYPISVNAHCPVLTVVTKAQAATNGVS